MNRIRETTTTLLVLEKLRERDDFLTASQLSKLTGRSARQVWAALLHLRAAHAVGVEIQGVGSRGQPLSYWYALPDEEDQRVRTHDEYTPTPKRPHKRRTKSGKVVMTK